MSTVPGEERCFHQLFEEQVKRTPGAIAAVCRGRRLTYADLNDRANRLAHFLRAQAIGPESLVGVYCERSVELMVAVLGVLKAGGAYVPLDPVLPAERLALLLDDAGAGFILTQSNLAARLPRPIPRLRLDTEWDLARPHPARNLECAATLDNLAYVLYTSGSTGKPKGVEVPHRGLANYLCWAAHAYSAGLGSGAPVHSSIGFDATITGWFTPLLAGKTITFVPEERELEELAELLQAGRDFTLVKLTPAHLEALRRLLPDGAAPGAGAFVIGGEALFGHHLAFWQQRAPGTRLINEYGPTETVVGCCVFEADPRKQYDGAVPIGRPIANTQLYVLDGRLDPVRDGEPGELYIGGSGVARGYHNRPELTAAKFLANPFGPGRLYRSGDLVRRLPDGNLVFLGRLDDQVKIRGVRIEPAEVEAALAAHPAVASCAVVARDDAHGEKRLVAYVTARRGRTTDASDLSGFLRAKLPPYMLPSAYVPLDRLPLTANGKLDRAALPRPVIAEGRPRSRGPRTNLELQILRVFESVLGVRPIGAHDDFFELGGHSLMALRLVDRIERATGRRLPLSAVSEAPTVEKMARLLSRGVADPTPDALVAIQPEGSRPPLFCVHGIGGTILNYGHLARYLGEDQPFYGLQARGIDGREPPHTSVESMAEDYIARIRSAQPAGPYFLGGYSFGGVVAFEMARRLETAGERVGLLLLFDSPAQGALRRLPQGAYWRALLNRQVRRALLHGGNLVRLSLAEKVDYLRREWRTVRRKLGNRLWQVRYKFYEASGQPVPRALLDVKQAAYMAARDYLPGRYSGKAVLFRAEQHPAVFEDVTLGWSRLIEGGVEVRIVPGEHNTITVGENAAVLAAEVMAALDVARNAESMPQSAV